MSLFADPANNFKSTLELTPASGCNQSKNHRDFPNNTEESNSSKVFRIVWHAIYEKCDYLRRRTKIFQSFVSRESNKPLAKQFRRSLRLNKSAKKKGYEQYMSDEDKRCL